MTTLREAAQQALEAICSAKLCEFNSMSSRVEQLRLMDNAIAALRAALSGSIKPASNPREWQGLTDDEIRTVFALCRNGSLHELARAIEAKLKEKNT